MTLDALAGREEEAGRWSEGDRTASSIGPLI